MIHLTTLPPEILHNVFQWLGVQDLGHLPRTCKLFNSFVRDNRALFRDVYLTNLDTPPTSELDWVKEVKDAARLQTLCSQLFSHRSGDKRAELPFVYHTVTRLLQNASPSGQPSKAHPTRLPSRNAELVSSCLSNRKARSAFLCRSSLYHATPFGRRLRGAVSLMGQESAKLHCLSGQPVLDSQHPSGSSWAIALPFHGASAKVYDLEQYTQPSMWGPFKADGSGDVDWEKVESIMVTLAGNIARNPNFETQGLLDAPSFLGSWKGSYVTPQGRKEESDLDKKDPYGITGTWLRVVSFLDFTDLHTFNFPHAIMPWRGSHEAKLFSRQETRWILMNVKVTRIAEPTEEDGQELPVVHFKGTSRSVVGQDDSNGTSEIKGTVRLTKQGEVRWTSFSIFGGEARWRSECIQLGGVRSARGVFGNWFDVDYDQHGPVGPTALWKISDDVSEKLGLEIISRYVKFATDAADFDVIDEGDDDADTIEIMGFPDDDDDWHLDLPSYDEDESDEEDGPLEATFDDDEDEDE